LKLAAGLTPGQMKHLADIQELIKTVKLPRELGETARLFRPGRVLPDLGRVAGHPRSLR
jgi:hypothetical protein